LANVTQVLSPHAILGSFGLPPYQKKLGDSTCKIKILWFTPHPNSQKNVKKVKYLKINLCKIDPGQFCFLLDHNAPMIFEF